jgi:hypothetical protein
VCTYHKDISPLRHKVSQDFGIDFSPSDVGDSCPAAAVDFFERGVQVGDIAFDDLLHGGLGLVLVGVCELGFQRRSQFVLDVLAFGEPAVKSMVSRRL